MKNFFKNKRVFITGHTGFKGIWLCSILNTFGAKVYGYSKKDTHLKNFKKLCKFNDIKTYVGDILDKNSLKSTLKKSKAEIIIHLAAQSLVQRSYLNPVETIETNLIGTMNLLECCREINKIKVILVATSDKCYENNEKKNFYFDENYKLGGDDPYSASKACAEIIFNAYNKSFYKNNKIGLATVRAGNVIGGGDWSSNRIIPDCAKSIKYKNNLILRNPDSYRPWQHVMDVLNGYLILIMKLYIAKNKKSINGSYNFGPDDKRKYTVKKVALKFYKSINLIKKIIIKKDNFNKEKNKILLNSSKSRKKLNWSQNIKTNKAIKLSADWYYNYIYNNKNIILKQIVESKLFY